MNIFKKFVMVARVFYKNIVRWNSIIDVDIKLENLINSVIITPKLVLTTAGVYKVIGGLNDVALIAIFGEIL